MTRISRFARPLGIALAGIGLVLVGVSAFYLIEYARSGSDAEEFNVQAAPPEDYLALLGQGIPRRTVSDDTSNATSDDVESDASVAYETTIGEPVRLTSEIDRSETVSIASVLPRFGRSDDAEPSVASAERSLASVSLVPGPGDSFERVSVAEERGSNGVVETSYPAVSSTVMVETFAAIYPGGNMNPRYWSDPHWAGNMPFGGPTIPDGFVPVDASAMDFANVDGERGVRMEIPAIELDAIVSELELRDLGDYRAWSTPDRVVGHIPTTANPGEPARGWYFGHLSNFISNEGDIFRRLPEIAGMIDNDPVDIFLTTADAEYMYRVTETQQVHRDDLHLNDSTNSTITLVTCWPFRVYDHRVLVTAVLIAVKPLQDA